MHCDPKGFWDTVPGVSQMTRENGCDKDALRALALKPDTRLIFMMTLPTHVAV